MRGGVVEKGERGEVASARPADRECPQGVARRIVKAEESRDTERDAEQCEGGQLPSLAALRSFHVPADPKRAHAARLARTVATFG